MPARPRSELARWQAGLVTRGQALRAGLTSNAITSNWLFHARWTQVHRGVYVTFTGPITREAQLWAAVLYAGPGARLSHETAAEIIRLADRESPLIHVAIPVSRRVRPPQGMTIHLRPAGTQAGGLRAVSRPIHSPRRRSSTWRMRRQTSTTLSPASPPPSPGTSRARNVCDGRLPRASGFAGAPISARSSRRRRTARTRSLSTATTATLSGPTGSRLAVSRSRSPSPTVAGAAATATTSSTV